MKVGIVIMQFPAPSETFASNDIKEISRRIDEAHVFTMRPNTEFHRELICQRQLESISIYSIRLKEFVIGSMLLLFYIRHVSYLMRCIFCNLASFFRMESYKQICLIPISIIQYRKIKALNLDLVHLFWGHYPSLIGLLVKRYCSGTKVSVFVGAYDLELSLSCSRKMLSVCDFVLTHSDGNSNKISSLYNRTANVIYRGVDLERLGTLSTRNGTDNEDNKIHISTCSRLIKEKGVDDVLRCISKVLSQFDNVFLTVIGDGPDRSRLEKLVRDLGIAEHVIFKGHLSHDLVLKNIADSDIFLFLSRYGGERLPNVIKEAMALGTICVSSRTTDIHELIQDNSTGFLVDIGDYETAAKHITNVIAHGAAAQKEKVNNAKLHIRNNFSVRASIEKTLQIWQKVDE
ncbi:MAG: glycosyltransferase family 4 protein [Paraglaciecola sp.]